MNRRSFLRSALATLALSTGLARASIALVDDEPVEWVLAEGDAANPKAFATGRIMTIDAIDPDTLAAFSRGLYREARKPSKWPAIYGLKGVEIVE